MGMSLKYKKSCLLPKSHFISFQIQIKIVSLGRTEIGSAYLIHIRYMRSGNYFYLEECLISKYVKLTGLDEMIRTDIHYITRCLSVHACMSVRPSNCLSNFNFECFTFLPFLHRYIDLIYHLITYSFALIFTAQQYLCRCITF